MTALASLPRSSLFGHGGFPRAAVLLVGTCAVWLACSGHGLAAQSPGRGGAQRRMSRFSQALCNKPNKARTGGPGMEEQDLQQWGLTAGNCASIHSPDLSPRQLERFHALQQGIEVWVTVSTSRYPATFLPNGRSKMVSTMLRNSARLHPGRRDGSWKDLSDYCSACLFDWKVKQKAISDSLSSVCVEQLEGGAGKIDKATLNMLEKERKVNMVDKERKICLKDGAFLKSFNWAALVVDEAHRLKNQNSLLHKTLSEFSVGFSLLLTGTPVQNSLQELYSLLSFIEPDIFLKEQVEEFVQCYHGIEKESKPAKELHSLLQPFLLRRVKAEVVAELPKKVEVVLYHGMSALQRKYYKAILMKDLDAFENEAGRKVKLQNVLIQLRKCVAHPYLFSGVEPEPFEVGDHLIDASGKLCLLDKLLSFLYAGGHRVLLFSQMTRMLDILQDYMDYRGYSYERLDGSVRGEERHLAIKNFGQQPIFVFLLSTRAGGVGMNLTAADTVIFVDSDFNPQNDLQATARAHRIGQNKPVKIIRLIGRDTVEEIIYCRAESKLQFTNTIIEGGQFALGIPKSQEAADMQLSEILKFGLDKLLSSEGSTIQDVDLENILGETKEGMWIADVVLPSEEESGEQDTENHMYLYEGKDYSKEPSREDRRAFEQLLDLQKVLEETNKEGRALRNKANVLVMGLQEAPTRRKHALSPEEVEARRKKRQEAAAKRARLMEEKKQKKAETEHKKKMAWWEANHYRSPCLPSEESDTEEAFEEGADEQAVELDDMDPELNSIKYVMGDVTHPKAEEEDAVIVHCIDDSGRWGRGGLFTALEVRSDQPRKIYELAGRMKDLTLGGTLLFPIDDKESRNKGQDLLALIVAQHRDRSNNLSGIKLSALEEGLKKIYLAAKKRSASIHLPRIGHATKGFNWYGTERLIRKYLATRGIPTFIYYFPRNKASSSSSQLSTTSVTTSNP